MTTKIETFYIPAILLLETVVIPLPLRFLQSSPFVPDEFKKITSKKNSPTFMYTVPEKEVGDNVLKTILEEVSKHLHCKESEVMDSLYNISYFGHNGGKRMFSQKIYRVC